MIAGERGRRRRVRRGGPGRSGGGAAPSTAAIPYEYAATFDLKGTPGNVIEDVINISVEGVFVAVGVGYGFEEERGRSLTIRRRFDEGEGGVFNLGGVELAQIPQEALIQGFRVDPRSETIAFEEGARDSSTPFRRARRLSNRELPDDFRSRLLQSLRPPAEISFLFSMVDTASGRELQDEPAHNLASLGKSNGQRPFRLLAQPLSFQPRSTVRLQVIERSEGVEGTLFIVLYGYKLFDAMGSPDAAMRSLRDLQATPPRAARSSSRVIPFDYVSTLELSGRPGNVLQDEVNINVEGGFVATALGYGLAVDSQDVRVRLEPDDIDSSGRVDLMGLPLDRFPPDALSDGLRVRPSFLRIAFSPLERSLVDQVFERLNRPADVSFRYSIFDTGTGRELQNQPLHNVAGLGTADGDRPFKLLARPMVFLPRSAARITVEERFGRGRLFLVLQGYKLLGGGARGRAA